MHPAYLEGAYQAARSGSCESLADLTYTTVHGVALIPVQGALTQYTTDSNIGYDWIKANFLKALTDSGVKAIALVIDSGGGDVAGCFDLVDFIYGARWVKPLLAICSEHAYSAAYAIASACEQVTVPRTGGVGSVGVIAAHTDMSGSLEKKGIAVTLVHYGNRKADGSDSRPLAPDAHARMQADVDAMGELFVETVARNRGMTPDAVRAMQAGTYLGQAGVDIGLADAVMSVDDAFYALLGELG
jgi:signal peptide peptidase SppA